MARTRKQAETKAKANRYFRAQEERLGEAAPEQRPDPRQLSDQEVLEKLVLEGDTDPFIARAFKDLGFPFEDVARESLITLAREKRAVFQRLRARLKTETDVYLSDFDAIVKRRAAADDEDSEFSMTDTGLYRVRNAACEWLSQPFEVLGLARDGAANDWSKIVRFKTVDGRVRQAVVSVAMLHSDPAQAIDALTFQGMDIKCTPKARLSFVEYLAAAESNEFATIASCTGWIDVGGSRAFVLPDAVVGPGLAETVVLARGITGPYERSGVLEEWREGVARQAGDHCLPRFSISTALAGTLLYIGGFESGAFHLCGQSSEGKTTCLRCGASVWGSGADGGYMRTWRATSNGLEGNLAAACDTLLPLDEVGQADGKEIGLALYMATAGVGKARMRRDATLKAAHKWRVLILSSGEMPIETKLNEDMRRGKAQAGHLVRAVDIDARRDCGVFDRPYVDAEVNPEAVANGLRRAASTHYGVAGPEFVRRLIESGMTSEGLRKRVGAFVDDVLKDIGDYHGQVARVAERFGLVAIAGELAVELGIVPWGKGVSTDDAAELFAAWLKARGGVTRYEAQQAVAQVRGFIERFGDSRFDDITSATGVSTSAADFLDQKPVHDRAGYRQGAGANKRWLILPEAWRKEVCKGLNPALVAKTLRELGMLEGGTGHYTQVVWAPVLERAVRVYVVTPDIFEN
jgi:uncharacterized protein (DUF927 family)